MYLKNNGYGDFIDKKIPLKQTKTAQKIYERDLEGSRRIKIW